MSLQRIAYNIPHFLNVFEKYETEKLAQETKLL